MVFGLNNLAFLGGGAGPVTEITIDGVAQTVTDTTATSKSVSITVASNSNRILIAIVSQEGGSTTSLKVGSNNFTLADSVSAAAGRVEIYYLVEPAVGSNQVDWVGTAGTNLGIGVYSFFGVDQASPIGVISNTSGVLAQQPNGTITPTTTGSMILDGLIAQSLTAPVDTLTAGYVIEPSSSRFAASQYDLTPTISSSNSMAYSGLTGGFTWAWAAIEVKLN